ncbi:hypothetical protein GHA01_16510 [Novacetimonas hansenii]|uniref:Uncharacterized protein n=1 Tax=Novacetimonas hansenii TaxID=436 RepID=A0ABQ0SEQ5_NOVHA|nr:hypothetical protein Gaha_0091_011 [Novacetimonas hansenii JCM 7643]GEC63802.1 hypothetical protein GHA01_16510 [Novacetimonas hansenii]
MPQSTEATVKAATAQTNSLTCPNRRDSQPVRGMKMAFAIPKEVMVHSPISVLTPRLPEMVGTETFAIVISVTAIKEARPIVIAANARSGPDSGWIGWGAGLLIPPLPGFSS